MGSLPHTVLYYIKLNRGLLLTSRFSLDKYIGATYRWIRFKNQKLREIEKLGQLKNKHKYERKCEQYMSCFTMEC